MYPANYKHKSNVLTRITAFLLVFIAVMGLQACGGGGGNDPVVTPKDADPKGYFTGTALLNGGAVDVQDMVGMAYDKRLMVFSMVENLLFDITITDITIDDFSGTVDVYTNGQITGSGVTVSGTTSNTRIQGTFAGGIGLATGDFDITFDTNNNLGASIERIESQVADSFTGSLSGIDSLETLAFFIVGGSGGYTISDANVQKCVSAGTNIGLTDPSVNIYQLDHNVVPQTTSTTCLAPYASTGHTGFASVISSVTDNDTVIFAYANGDITLFSDDLKRFQ